MTSTAKLMLPELVADAETERTRSADIVQPVGIGELLIVGRTRDVRVVGDVANVE